MTTRVAVTSRSFSRHPLLRADLLARYDHVSFNDAGLSLRGESLIEFLRGHDKAITALEPLDAALFAALPELRVVGKYGVGLDMIDLHAMREAGVKLGWTGGVNKRSVSELVIAFAIALLRHVPAAHHEVCNGTWRQHTGRLLTGKTVGIIGCGHVGKDLTSLLRAFDCRIIANDILDFPEFYAANHVTPVSLENLLRESDVVTIHTPLQEDTRNLLSAERLALVKPSAVLINLARGGLVDEDAVYSMLTNNRLAAAGFDVFAIEPPDNPALLSLPNFLASPHIGGSAEESILAMGRSAIDGLETFGDPLEVAKS